MPEISRSKDIRFAQSQAIYSNGLGRGSFCCIVQNENNKQYLVTAGHILSKNRIDSYGGWLSEDKRQPVYLNGNYVGLWEYQIINHRSDFALVSIGNSIENAILFGPQNYFIPNQTSIGEPVELVSAVSGRRKGYLLGYNTQWRVPYFQQFKEISGIILVGSTNSKDTSKALSTEGDSGGLVFHPASNTLIGLILGSNQKYTWVLPIKKILENLYLNLG